MGILGQEKVGFWTHWKGRVIMGAREGVGAEAGAEAEAEAASDQAEVKVRAIGTVGVGAEEEASVGAIGRHRMQALDMSLAAHLAPYHGPLHVRAVAANHLIAWIQDYRVDLINGLCTIISV